MACSPWQEAQRRPGALTGPPFGRSRAARPRRCRGQIVGVALFADLRHQGGIGGFAGEKCRFSIVLLCPLRELIVAIQQINQWLRLCESIALTRARPGTERSWP